MKRLYSCPGGGVRGFLTVKVRRGNSLRNTDGLLSKPDPYVVVTAADSNGGIVKHQTSHKQGQINPVWNQVLLFGNRSWQFIRISAWDKDIRFDDQVTMSKTVTVSLGNHYSLRTCENTACSSYILYDYYLDTSSIQDAQLRVYVRYAGNLKDTDPISSRPDPYVRIRAT